MLGSMKKCSNCHGTKFQRIKINRTVQCENCKLILEERCMSDLLEFHAVTQTEEVYCVVTPDFLHNHLVDDIPNDPYCTPGFISAFRMLSPLREPVYAASSRTLNGALAEMERLIGDALFAGYVGYNGRAPGGSVVKKEEPVDSSERNKSGGDARHTLVAYFEIVELGSILCVDKETTNLAIRIFRHTASNTSLRNRNVESLATAAFVAATERRWHEYQQWLKESEATVKAGDFSIDPNPESPNSPPPANTPWPVPPRRLSVEEISAAANLDTSEVLRCLKVVNIALKKQRAENNSSITEHMPTFCRRLELPERTQNLAIAIAENAMHKNICSRRNPASVAAAAIYLACQLDGVRKTQTEICRATPLTEVTLRKVRNELNAERDALLPAWYNAGEKHGVGHASDVLPGALSGEEKSNEPSKQIHGSGVDVGDAQPTTGKSVSIPPADVLPEALVPPPLPPGFGETQGSEKATAQDVEPSTASPATQVPEQGQKTTNPVNPLMAMVNNPAMQAFANAFSMMPQFMMPPPPPPLPPSLETAKAQEKGSSVEDDAQKTSSEDRPEDKSASGTANTTQSENQGPSAPTNQPPTDVMAGIQSMMGMMQAMQAFQAMQQSTQSPNASPAAQNPWAMMANAVSQTQQSAPAQSETLKNGRSGKSEISEEDTTGAKSNSGQTSEMKKENSSQDPMKPNG